MRRLPTTLVLVALAAALLLAGCGAPTPPVLTLTGVTPSIALPGDSVTLSGSALASGQTVTFDGVPVTVASVSADGASMTVVVPATAGYPLIAVEDVELAEALFVGHAYAGPLTLAGIQAALDPLPEGAALRVGAGSYTGSELTLDNRSLYGAGPTTILQPTTELVVLARSRNTTALADLRVEGGDLTVTRGRLTTAEAEPPAGFATAVLADLELDIMALRTTGADFVEVVLRDSTVDAASVDALAQYGRLRIERSTVGSGSAIVVQNLHGIAIADAQLTATAGPFVLFGSHGVEIARSTLAGTDGVTLVAQVGAVALEAVTASATGPIQVQANGGLDVQDASLTSASDVVALLVLGDAALVDTTLTAGAALALQVQFGTTRIADGTLTAATDLQIATQDALTVEGIALTATAGSIAIQALTGFDVADATLSAGNAISVQSTLGPLAWRSTAVDAVGPIAFVTEGHATVVSGSFTSTTGGLDLVGAQQIDVDGATIAVQGQATFFSDRGATTVLDADVVTSASSVVVYGRGAVVVRGGSMAAAGNVTLVSVHAGDVTLEASDGITADAVVVTAGVQPFAGVNGQVTIVGNGPITATTAVLVDSPVSDLLVADNAPIVGGTLSVNGGGAHVTLRDNERLESGADLAVVALDPGGRITATGNAFVANAGAGTITLATLAGQLTQSGNVFTGTTSFPNNP